MWAPISTSDPKRPAVLVAHGHWKHGPIELNEAYSVPALGAALAYDMIGNDSSKPVTKPSLRPKKSNSSPNSPAVPGPPFPGGLGAE